MVKVVFMVLFIGSSDRPYDNPCMTDSLTGTICMWLCSHTRYR